MDGIQCIIHAYRVIHRECSPPISSYLIDSNYEFFLFPRVFKICKTI